MSMLIIGCCNWWQSINSKIIYQPAFNCSWLNVLSICRPRYSFLLLTIHLCVWPFNTNRDYFGLWYKLAFLKWGWIAEAFILGFSRRLSGLWSFPLLSTVHNRSRIIFITNILNSMMCYLCGSVSLLCGLRENTSKNPLNMMHYKKSSKHFSFVLWEGPSY